MESGLEEIERNDDVAKSKPSTNVRACKQILYDGEMEIGHVRIPENGAPSDDIASVPSQATGVLLSFDIEDDCHVQQQSHPKHTYGPQGSDSNSEGLSFVALLFNRATVNIHGNIQQRRC